MKTASIPLAPAAARALARALSERGASDFLRLAEELSQTQPQAFLEPLSASLSREPAIEAAFPEADFSLALDLDPEADYEPPERSLGLAVCLCPALWRLGAEFGSDEGERARSLFSRLCQTQLDQEPLRGELIRQGLGGALWSSTPRARLELTGEAPEGLEPELAEASISFWRQSRLLGMLDPYAKDIEPEFEEDDPLSAFELILLASGCPPREEEARWSLRALGGASGIQSGLGPLWAPQLAQIAAETLNAPALELASPGLSPNDLLARQIWPALAEAAELSCEFIEEASASEGLREESPSRVERLRSEALAEIIEACRRCCLAAAPCGAPLESEIGQFPPRLQEAARLAAFSAPDAPPRSAGAQVIAHDFRKKS